MADWATPKTEADFEGLSWHDNSLYGLRLIVGDPDRGDWRSEIALDIDHIVEWLCGADRRVRFRVAPAELIFHQVSQLKIDADWGAFGEAMNINEMSIDAITRTALPENRGGPYWRWRIALNLPAGGTIAFRARGFTQTLRSRPRILDQQSLPRDQRG